MTPLHAGDDAVDRCRRGSIQQVVCQGLSLEVPSLAEAWQPCDVSRDRLGNQQAHKGGGCSGGDRPHTLSVQAPQWQVRPGADDEDDTRFLELRTTRGYNTCVLRFQPPDVTGAYLAVRQVEVDVV